ncbi:MAG: hypothetical protein ACRD1U_18050 [Vicinamibacterales bacterium]
MPAAQHALKAVARALGVALALGLSVATVRAEVIDRILAVVNGQIITLSDARAALRLGLVPPDVSKDPIDAVMQRLIDRRLMLVEVDRYAPPEPAEPEIDSAVAAIRDRYSGAAGFDEALKQTVVSREELRRYVRDSLRIDAYLQQRFTSLVEPSAAEAVVYYREHAAEFTAGGQLRPFEDVREEARRRLIEQRRAAFVREWVDGLRRRASLVILYLPGASSMAP